MKIYLLIILLYSTISSDVYYYKNGKKVELFELKYEREIGDDTKYYQNSAGQKIGVKNEILVKCNEEIKCKKIFIKYNLDNIKTLSKSIFLITLKPTQNAFKLSRKLYLEKEITISHPNFLKKRHKR